MVSLSQPFKYTRLSRASDHNDDAFEEEEFADKPMRMAPSPRRSFLRRHATKLLVGFLLFLLTLAAIAALTRAGHLTIRWSASSRLPINQCGSSPAEARALGCRFEMHNFAWVPAACYDEELGAEWDSHADWTFSRTANDSSDTDAAFVAACRAGEVREAWVPWYQHMAHCSLIMKKYMRSVMFDRPMDNWTADWHHGQHCNNMMPRYDVDPWFFNSLLHLKFPTCDYSWRDAKADPKTHGVMPTWHGHQ